MVRELELSGQPQGGDPPRGTLLTLFDWLAGPFLRGAAPQPRPATGFYTDTTVCIGCKACEVACKQWNQLPADGLRWSGHSYDNTRELSATSWRHVKFIEQFPSGVRRQASGVRRQASGVREARAGNREQGTESENDNASRVSLPLVSPPPSPLADPWPLTPDPSFPMGRWLMMSDVCKHCVTAPCQQACPTGSIVYNEFGNVYIQPDICNGCAYCIAACPFGVITRAAFDGHAHKCTLCFDRQRDGLVPACAKACPTASIQFGPVDELRERAGRRVAELRRRGVADAYLYGDQSTDTYSAVNSFYLLVDRPEVYGLPDKPFNPWLHMAGDYARSVAGGLAAVVVFLLTLWLAGG